MSLIPDNVRMTPENIGRRYLSSVWVQRVDKIRNGRKTLAYFADIDIVTPKPDLVAVSDPRGLKYWNFPLECTLCQEGRVEKCLVEAWQSLLTVYFAPP